MHRWGDHTKIEGLLFRASVDAKIDLQDKERISQTKGVARFVGIRGIPTPVSEARVDWPRRIIGEPGNVRREKYFEVG